VEYQGDCKSISEGMRRDCFKTSSQHLKRGAYSSIGQFLFSIFYFQDETGVSDGIFARKHHFNSWLISVISIPGITMNLQLSISWGSSSSGNWHVTRQYWQSWFQQKRPYGIVSGLMN
jgi:hypothetical protein